MRATHIKELDELADDFSLKSKIEGSNFKTCNSTYFFFIF